MTSTQLPDKISDLHNNCTLTAVKKMSSLPDATILAAFVKNGYVKDKGMKNHQWTQAARDLGLQLEGVKTSRLDPLTKQYQRHTLASFIREYPTGDFFISVAGHALIIRDGKVMDNYPVPRLRRRVWVANRVLNAPPLPTNQPTGEFIKVLVNPFGAKRYNTQAFARYQEMWTFTNAALRTSAEIFANTSYTPADLKHDLAKGLLTYTDGAQ